MCVCDKDVCERWCVTKKDGGCVCVTKLCVCVRKMVCDKVVRERCWRKKVCDKIECESSVVKDGV